MSYVRCIGRVGALAVALGIGVTVATTPRVALADSSDTSDSSSASSSDSSSSTQSPDKDTASQKDSVSKDTSLGAADDDGPSNDPRSGIVVDHNDASHRATDDDAPVDDDAQTTVDDAEPTEAHLDEDSATPSEGAKPSAGPSAAEHRTTGSEPSAEPSSPRVPATMVVAGYGPSDNQRPAPVSMTAVEPDRRAAVAVTVISAGSSEALPVSAAVTQTSAAPASPVSVVSPFGVVSGLVSGFLAWVGLGPSLTTAPSAPAATPVLWGLLAWVRREVQRVLWNQTPTINYNPAENSQTVAGVVTGDLNAVDADGDPLKFTVTDAPDNGSVVVNKDGTFIYTPSRQLAAAGGIDFFTVKVEDQGNHFHGLRAFFEPDLGHSVTATIAVPVRSRFVIATIDVGDRAVDVAVSPDGTRGYVTSSTGDTVSVIDTATDTVVATVSVGDNPSGVAVRPDGGRAYVTNAVSDTLSVIDTATNTVIATVPVGDNPTGVAVSPDGARAYVANLQDDAVSVIDTVTNTVTATIPLGTARAVWWSAPTVCAPTSPTRSPTRCR